MSDYKNKENVPLITLQKKTGPHEAAIITPCLFNIMLILMATIKDTSHLFFLKNYGDCKIQS